MEPRTSNLTISGPAKYRIRAVGEIDESWADYYGGMFVRIENPPGELKESILVGWLDDQAALLGVMERLYNKGFPIISVEHQQVSDGTDLDKGAET